MGVFYLNHNILEFQITEQTLKEKIIEIIKVNHFLSSQSYNMYVYSNLWDITVLNQTLRSYLYKISKDEAIVFLLAFINAGPFYYDDGTATQLRINPSINGESFAKKILEICFKDKHSLIMSISDEIHLVNQLYEVSTGTFTHKIENHIGMEGISTYFENNFVPVNSKDIFRKVEEQYNDIVILDSAKKSAEQHNFMGRFNEIYKAIIALKDVELSLLSEGASIADRKKLFYENTGFEISPETDKTLKTPKYRREREFIIPEAGKVLFEWHIKIGNSTRIHYYIDKQNYKIYIGHCGKHLGTSSYNS